MRNLRYFLNKFEDLKEELEIESNTAVVKDKGVK
jgi:hypothetical protein